MAMDELRVKRAENGFIVMRKVPVRVQGQAEFITDFDIVKEVAKDEGEAMDIIKKRLGEM